MAKKAVEGGNAVAGENTIYKVSPFVTVVIRKDYKLTIPLGDV
jgi:hypothetical protein